MENKESKYKEKRSLFTMISEKTASNSDDPNNPFIVKRRLSGYNTATVVFIAFGVLAGIMTKSLFAMGLGLLLAAAIAFLGYIQKKNVARDGYEVWRMEVLEETRLTRLNRRPTGIHVEALDGPYKGRICHLALSSQGPIPPVGRIIEVTVPGNMQPNLVRDVYQIPQYYGIELARDEQ